MRSALLAPFAAVFLALGAPSALQSQILGGTVVEENSGQPVPDVEVQIIFLHNGQRVGPVLRTGHDGRFGMRVPSSGSYELRFRRVGYVSQTLTDVSMARNEVRNIEIMLVVHATTLAEVRVAPRPSARPFFMEGFEQRRRMGVGTFLTRDDIQRSGIHSLTNVIRGMAGVHVTQRGQRATVTGTQINTQRMCNMVLFVDGALVSSATSSPDAIFRSFDMIPVEHIEALEVYRGRASLPAEFGGPDVRCGAIVVWTRRPGLEDYQHQRKPHGNKRDAEKKEGVVTEVSKVDPD